MDPVHFSIVMIISGSPGFLTPPAGVSLFGRCAIRISFIQKLSMAVLLFPGSRDHCPAVSGVHFPDQSLAFVTSSG